MAFAPTSLAFYGLVLLWVGGELWLDWRKRAGPGAQRRDRGSLRLLSIVIYLSVAVAVWLSFRGLLRFSAALSAPLFWLGIALMAAGLAFRWWAIRVLDRFFTVDVAVHDDHRLVRSGPYRWLRHPSYTGALTTFFGFGLALGNWASLIAIMVPVTLAFLRRIRVEDQALREAFPMDYDRYSRETKRLLPFFW